MKTIRSSTTRTVPHFPIRFAAFAAAIALLAAPVGAGAVPASASRIVEVTVFPDRAEIVREARADLPAGGSTVEFSGLPFNVEPDSLRVTAKGVAAALGAVELKQAADQPKETPEFIAARDDVQRLENEMFAINAEEATGKDLRDFISSLKAGTSLFT